MNQVYLTGLLDGILSRQPLPSWVVSVLLKHGWHQDEDVPPAEKEKGMERPVSRWEQIRMYCSKCPIPQEDCQWMADTFQQPNKPEGKAEKWCPLLVAIGNIMTVLSHTRRGE